MGSIPLVGSSEFSSSLSLAPRSRKAILQLLWGFPLVQAVGIIVSMYRQTHSRIVPAHCLLILSRYLNRQKCVDYGHRSQIASLHFQPSKRQQIPKDPNVVSSQQEEDDIAKAIQMSLQETKATPQTKAQVRQL